MLPETFFCWFIIIINAGKLNCKDYSIIDLGFQEYTSQIQDFFSTSVQFQDFSGPEKSSFRTFQVLKNPNSNFRTFQNPWEPCSDRRYGGERGVEGKHIQRGVIGVEFLRLDALPVANQCYRHPLELIHSSTTNKLLREGAVLVAMFRFTGVIWWYPRSLQANFCRLLETNATTTGQMPLMTLLKTESNFA